MTLFGAAYAAPNTGTTILYWFRSLSTVLSPTEKVEFKDFSRLLSDFPVLFKADLILKDFSRKPSKFKYFSSLCEPWKLTEVWRQTDRNLELCHKNQKKQV